MTLLNALMGRTFDVLLSPFRHLPPLAGLTVVSLVSGLVVVLIYRATSDQRRITDVKRRIAAALFEIRLFNDDPPAVFRAQAELLRHNATYLRLSFVPMLWTIVPIALLLAQLDIRYAYTGLTPGEPVMLTFAVRQGVAPESTRDAALDAPSGISVLTPPVWFPTANELVWTIRPDAPGAYELAARIGGETFTKTVEVSDAVVRRSPVRVERGFVAELTNPAERPLPSDAAVNSISVRYPPRAIRVLGWEFSWLVVFLVTSTIFALLLTKPLGVTI